MHYGGPLEQITNHLVVLAQQLLDANHPLDRYGGLTDLARPLDAHNDALIKRILLFISRKPMGRRATSVRGYQLGTRNIVAQGVLAKNFLAASGA